MVTQSTCITCGDMNNENLTDHWSTIPYPTKKSVGPYQIKANNWWAYPDPAKPYELISDASLRGSANPSQEGRTIAYFSTRFSSAKRTILLRLQWYLLSLWASTHRIYWRNWKTTASDPQFTDEKVTKKYQHEADLPRQNFLTTEYERWDHQRTPRHTNDCGSLLKEISSDLQTVLVAWLTNHTQSRLMVRRNKPIESVRSYHAWLIRSTSHGTHPNTPMALSLLDRLTITHTRLRCSLTWGSTLKSVKRLHTVTHTYGSVDRRDTTTKCARLSVYNYLPLEDGFTFSLIQW